MSAAEETIRKLPFPDSPAPLFDMHAHLDFDPDMKRLPFELAQCSLRVFAQSVTPEGFRLMTCAFSLPRTILVGLGIHPWYVNEKNQDALFEDFRRQAPSARCFGEIGLDFGPRFVRTAALQTQTLRNVLAQATKDDTLLSLHAVKSAGYVLDELETFGLLGPASIFHCFSGSSDDMQRAVRAGCRFSLSSRMLASKRGREYARIIPLSQILIESDAPAAEGGSYEPSALCGELQDLIVRIAEIRSLDAAELAWSIAENSQAYWFF